jgi:hypothetical protein
VSASAFQKAVTACIRRMATLKGGPSQDQMGEFVDAWMTVLAPLRKQRYPLTPDELKLAVNHFLQSESPWFPTPGEFKAQIERNRTRNWVTVSRVLSDGEDGQAGRITFIKCPPEKADEARRELFARTPDALPAPERTATDEHIEKLRSLKVFGLPFAGREVG